jgi:hypothetical protein
MASAQPIAADIGELHIRLRARHQVRLRALVEKGYRCSPIPTGVVNAVPVDLHVDVGAA